MKSRPLTDSEIQSILSHLSSPRDRALFVVGVKTGFRISELLSLTIADVQGSIITVRRCNMKGKKSSRSVVLHPLGKLAIEEFLASISLGNPEILSRSLDKKLFQITRRHALRIVSGAAKKAGLSGTISTHSMRKSLAMKVYKETKDIVLVQRVLGHASLSSTTRYLSVGQDEVDAAILA